MFLAIFFKKSFFFRVKKILTAFFLQKLAKKNEKLLYQMKVGVKLGKVKKFGIGWCFPHRVVADNAKGGGIGSKEQISVAKPWVKSQDAQTN